MHMKNQNKQRGEREWGERDKEREGGEIRKERGRRKRRKMETNDIIREKVSGPHGPCHIVSSILYFQIPVLSSGRFCS